MTTRGPSLLTNYPLQWWEASTGRLLKTWWWLDEEQALAITPTGHYRGSPGIDEHIVYIALQDDGSQLTLTPAEFEKAFGWKNNSTQVPDLGGAGGTSK